jgi:hypothetical protein
MTKEETKAWTDFVNSSKHHWVVDPIHDKAEDFLAFIGGLNGKFVHITGNTITVGSYVGAFPHIGDAEFREQGHRTFKSNQEAQAHMLQGLGVGFILDITGSKAYPKNVK